MSGMSGADQTRTSDHQFGSRTYHRVLYGSCLSRKVANGSMYCGIHAKCTPRYSHEVIGAGARDRVFARGFVGGLLVLL